MFNIYAYYILGWYVHIYTHVYVERWERITKRLYNVYKWKHTPIYTLNYFQLIISQRKNKQQL